MDKERIIKEVDNKIDTLVQQGLTSTATIDALDKLVDMKKDLMEIEKMEKGRYQGEYGNYGNYSEGGYGARGNYREGGYNEGNYNEGNYNEGSYGNDSYGRRGVKGTGRGRRRYRGDDMLDEMNEQYGRYSEGREQYGRGNYGAEEQTMKSLEYMLESVVDFVKMLEKEASSQQEVNLIKKYTKKIAEM